MVNEIIPVGNKIGEIELILGPLMQYKVVIRCTINYCIPDQEIWIVGLEEVLTAFGPRSFDDNMNMRTISVHSLFMCLNH